MVRVEHYKGLHTDIDRLYQSIREEILKERKLKIAAEFKGEMNGEPLWSITAVNASLKVLAGALREITISIVGDPDDFAVEVGSGACLTALFFLALQGLWQPGRLAQLAELRSVLSWRRSTRGTSGRNSKRLWSGRARTRLQLVQLSIQHVNQAAEAANVLAIGLLAQPDDKGRGDHPAE